MRAAEHDDVGPLRRRSSESTGAISRAMAESVGGAPASCASAISASRGGADAGSPGSDRHRCGSAPRVYSRCTVPGVASTPMMPALRLRPPPA